MLFLFFSVKENFYDQNLQIFVNTQNKILLTLRNYVQNLCSLLEISMIIPVAIDTGSEKYKK